MAGIDEPGRDAGGGQRRQKAKVLVTGDGWRVVTVERVEIGN